MLLYSTFTLLLLHLTVLHVQCAENELPNFLILLADDLGFGDLASDGFPTSYTPNLDWLTNNGVVMTQFYAGAPLCSPSRAALLTGRYPVRSGIYPGVFFPYDYGGLPETELTIAEALKSTLNYSTAIIGKWHIGVGENQEYLPTNYGFDYYYGIPYAHDMCPCKICFYPNDPCFDNCKPSLVSCPLFKNEDIIAQPVDFTTLTKKYTLEALRFIHDARKQKQPFFLYMSYQHTHHPQFAGKGFRNSTARGTFGDSLAEMDDSIGQILFNLRQMGILDNTIVWFTSDNGPSLERQVRGGNAGPLRCGKATTYEGGLRVPSIFYWEEHTSHRRMLDIVSALDVFPTFLTMAGIDTAQEWPNITIDGLDFSECLLDSSKECPRDNFIYYPIGESEPVIYAIRYQEYKAHFYTIGNALSDGGNYDVKCKSNTPKEHHVPPLLYNLQDDPGERYALEDSQYTEIFAIIEEIRVKANTSILWGESQINRGHAITNEPCCNKGCTPLPTCCDCRPSSNITAENNEV